MAFGVSKFYYYHGNQGQQDTQDCLDTLDVHAWSIEEDHGWVQVVVCNHASWSNFYTNGQGKCN